MDRKQEKGASLLALVIAALVMALTVWILWNASAEAKENRPAQGATLVQRQEGGGAA